MIDDNKHLSKEVLKLIQQYQNQLATAPYEPCISKRQIAEYRQEHEKLVHQLEVDDILLDDKSLSFKYMISKPYLIGGDML